MKRVKINRCIMEINAELSAFAMKLIDVITWINKKCTRIYKKKYGKDKDLFWIEKNGFPLECVSKIKRTWSHAISVQVARFIFRHRIQSIFQSNGNLSQAHMCTRKVIETTHNTAKIFNIKDWTNTWILTNLLCHWAITINWILKKRTLLKWSCIFVRQVTSWQRLNTAFCENAIFNEFVEM